MNGLSTVFLLVGLFLLGGVYSFWKQKLPKSVIVLLAIGSVLCLAAGIVRLEVWN
ncbi:hypothetical protein [Streptomyces sp. Ru73]|uniref:hypothetical protein n=1 Tax=Streptomyces sp. Ru73 TaxID=2080748 RepID=UPI0015E2E8E6|nr:hypothetical protein [Streptomyces sp. Ru73]